MAGRMTPEHIAAMQAGRARALEEKALHTERSKEAYSAWSKSNASLWLAWRDNCGQSQCKCEWCIPYRASNSAMPDMRGVEGES